MLNTDIYGTQTDIPNLLIAHGLFGSARNWGVIAKRLSTDRQVICVDMRNHGASFHADSMTYADMADDLRQVITAHGDASCDVLGHSMGGKAAMMLGLHDNSAVNRLIVADIAPITYDHTQTHLIDAMQAADLSAITKRSDVTLDIPESGIRAFLLQSLDVSARKWRFNLDALRHHMPDIIGFPDISKHFNGPTLFLSGAASDYVQPGHRDHIKSLFPAAQFAKIPGAGHWLHAEKPREFEAAVRVFLS